MYPNKLTRTPSHPQTSDSYSADRVNNWNQPPHAAQNNSLMTFLGRQFMFDLEFYSAKTSVNCLQFVYRDQARGGSELWQGEFSMHSRRFTMRRWEKHVEAHAAISHQFVPNRMGLVFASEQRVCGETSRELEGWSSQVQHRNNSKCRLNHSMCMITLPALFSHEWF